MNDYPDMFHELLRIIDTYRTVPFVEIEIRFGWKSQLGFDTNIGKSSFAHILSALRTSGLPCAEHEVVTNVYTNGRTRIITDMDHNIIDKHVKRKVELIDIHAHGTPFDVRVSVCTERPLTNRSHSSCADNTYLHTCTHVRKRTRSSYVYKNMWRYDLTDSIASVPPHELAMDLETFEVEIELDVRSANRQRVSSVYLAHSAALKILDILQLNPHEKINLKSTDVCDRRTYNHKPQNKPNQ